MSTQTATASGRPSRTTLQRGLNELGDSVRKVLDPLLMDATREAIHAIDDDSEVPDTLKKSVRGLLVDYRAFSAAFFGAVDRQVGETLEELLSGSHKESTSAKTDARSLSLVDFDQMEEEMMVDRVASRIRNAADSSFTPLNQRMAAVLGLQALVDRDNPFHPIRFCRALGEAVDMAGFRGEDRRAIVKAFDRVLLKPLVATYGELNSQLEQRGVQEMDAVAAFKNTVAGFRNTMVGTGRVTQAGQVTGVITGATAEQLLSALYHRMQVQPVAGTAAAMPQSSNMAMFERVESIGGAAAAAPFVSTASSAAVPIAPGVPIPFAAIDPALLASINEVQRLNAMATMAGKNGAAAAAISERDEHHLRQHVAEKATRQVDKLTIELVGMLFDRIHQDKHIPAEIKTALSRLQFPIMKVALADSELFVSPVQPARRLMDRIASTAIGWLPEGEDNVRYLAEVNKAINTVLVAINEGPAIFEKALDEFEKYLAEERVRDDDPVTRAKRALEEAETREVMAINAAIGIRRAFEGVQIESYLRDFLLDVWLKVLVSATLKERSHPNFSKKFRDAVSDLIWSVQPKINPEDRKRLVKTIPAVLGTMREGLQLIELPKAQSREFFTRLMASHAQAVKALEVAYGNGAPLDQKDFRRRIDEVQIVEPPPAQADEPMHQLTITADVVRSAVTANHAEVNVIEEPLTVAPEEMIPVDQLSDAAIDAAIEAWQRGSWFDLWTGQQTERVRLRWISPRRNFYLFTSAETGKAHSLAPLILRGYVRAGRIKSAERAPLFERVVGDLMRDLQGEGAAVPA
jgi:hypothetical protein